MSGTILFAVTIKQKLRFTFDGIDIYYIEEHQMESSSLQVVRYILGLSWVYHGLFPKILTVAPLEKQLTATLALSENLSYMVTKVAGIAEVLFGLALIAFYQNKQLIRLNIFALIALCLFVAIQMPTLLIEAFNPVTTNFALIGLSYVLLKNATKA
jgi:uncharacterized membrane protein YphA (DoxX/SURF4 family)